MAYDKKWHQDYYQKNKEQKIKYQKEKYHNTHEIRSRSFSEEQFQQRLKENYGDKFTTLTPYKNFNSEIKVKCNDCGNEWIAIGKNLLRGRGCKKCAILKQRKSNDKFVEEFISNYGNKYELLSDYLNGNTKIKVKCKKCDNIWETKPYHLSHTKSECPKCMHKKRGINSTKSQNQFVKDVYEKHQNKYIVVGNYINAKTKIEIKCNECDNNWKIVPYSLLQGVGCPICNQSKGENAIAIYLKEKGINYESHYTFDKCRNKNPLPFDFYLPKLNSCIEYDGVQHFKPVEFFGGEEKFLYNRENDDIKNIFCKDNKIRLIRISYKQFKNINKILENKL